MGVLIGRLFTKHRSIQHAHFHFFSSCLLKLLDFSRVFHDLLREHSDDRTSTSLQTEQINRQSFLRLPGPAQVPLHQALISEKSRWTFSNISTFTVISQGPQPLLWQYTIQLGNLTTPQSTVSVFNLIDQKSCLTKKNSLHLVTSQLLSLKHPIFLLKRFSAYLLPGMFANIYLGR